MLTVWLNFGVIYDFSGALMCYLWGRGIMQNNFYFIMILLFSTFDFDLILGSFWLFGALMGYFWGGGKVQNLFLGLLL